MTNTILDLKNVKTYPIKNRKNIVKIDQFAKLTKPSKDFREFFGSLPKILCANDLNTVIKSIVKSYRNGHKIGIAIGAHVVKCGLSPIIIDLMERGIVSCVSMNGSVAIHDYEISLIGETSEDVAQGIEDGSFGMAHETGNAFQEASKAGNNNETGLGRAIGEKILKDDNKYKEFSILSAGARLNIPTTVHVAIGTDIIHMHPNISGSDLGGSSHIDFKIMSSFISQLENGVWLNIGSAVIMPEVFLKALTVANNLGHNVQNFTTVNMDMIRQYRSETNVVKRPTKKGFSIIGHHEIMVPLLYMGITSTLEESG
ncbi:MAG: hypothetical protein ACUZ8O_11945 [Candidatus Anammoxibacter sp.]